MIFLHNHYSPFYKNGRCFLKNDFETVKLAEKIGNE